MFTEKAPEAAIKSVILGERTTVPDQREIYGPIKETTMALSLAAIDRSGYAFRRERIKFNIPASQFGPMMSPRTAHIFSDASSQRGEFARWMVDKHPMSKIVNKPVRGHQGLSFDENLGAMRFDDGALFAISIATSITSLATIGMSPRLIRNATIRGSMVEPNSS